MHNSIQAHPPPSIRFTFRIMELGYVYMLGIWVSISLPDTSIVHVKPTEGGAVFCFVFLNKKYACGV